MRYGRRIGWLGICVVLTVTGGVLATAWLGHPSGSTTVTPKGNFSVAQAREYQGFPVFYPGESVDAHRLTAVSRDPLGPLRKNQESVLFSYGTCEIPAGGEGGCSLPVSVSNEPPVPGTWPCTTDRSARNAT